jgi:hypothetical protein
MVKKLRRPANLDNQALAKETDRHFGLPSIINVGHMAA